MYKQVHISYISVFHAVFKPEDNSTALCFDFEETYRDTRCIYLRVTLDIHHGNFSRSADADSYGDLSSPKLLVLYV